jgi:hypothetical protein
MPVYLTPVKCPSCHQPIEGKTADLVFVCQCGVMHTRDDLGTREVAYQIASPRTGDVPPSSMVYIPFWVLDSVVTIHHSQSEGGWLLRKLLGQDGQGGRLYIFVPAVDWDPVTYKYWASIFTKNPPRFNPTSTFGPYERWAVTIEEDKASALADFMILTFEAEKQGVLQNISYEVGVSGTSLVYIPFLTGAKGLETYL